MTEFTPVLFEKYLTEMDKLNFNFKVNKSTLLKISAGLTLVVVTVFVAVISLSGTSVVSDEQPLLMMGAKTSSISSENDLTIMGSRDRLHGKGQLQRAPKSQTSPVVRIRSQGKVRGTILKSREGRDYFAFYQIPYAKDPVGDLRFEVPQKPNRWRNVRDGTKPGVECLQQEKYAATNTTGGEEGCLHVNVYTPKLPRGLGSSGEGVKLPTMFYVHGGGPYGNGTRYGAKYFMDRDVVLVTVEYRLGAFGSFVTKSGSLSGNQGFKDQVFALDWVKRNIDRFGGDPKKVVLFGNSAGSGAVHAHLLSPMSKGLYHRAIMQSGSAVTTGLSLSDPLERSQDFAAAVGCEDGSEEQLLTCLRAADAKPMAMGMASLMSSGMYPDVLPSSNTERKKLLDNNQVFLTDSPWNLAQSEGINKVPLMLGLVSQEQLHGPLGMLLTSENGTNLLNDHWNDIFPLFTGLKDDQNHSIAQSVRKVYFGDEPISNETRLSLFNFQSDIFMAHPCRTSAIMYQNHSSPAPVYLYWMTKEPARSYGESIRKIFPPPYGGPAHADELQYLFLYDGYPEIGLNSPWFNISKNMVNIWADFAESGEPRPTERDWPPMEAKDNGMKWFELGDHLGMVEPFTERMTIWDRHTEEMYGKGSETPEDLNLSANRTVEEILGGREHWQIDPSSP